MRRAMISWVLILALGVLCGCSATPQSQRPFDVILKGGRIVDGTGSPWYRDDVGIRNGVIAEIGNLTGRAATRTIDVAGLVVSPGFIDMMAGTTLPLLHDPVSGHSKLYQGITTMLVGEGGSVAPHNDRTAREPWRAAASMESGMDITWRTFREYFDLLEKKGVAMNVAHNIGATQVRRIVIGEEALDPTPEQLTKMKELVKQAMEDGAAGIASALIYPPGTYAKTEELIELAKVVAQYNGLYLSHMRNESNKLLEAIEEAIRIGKEAGLPVEIYHLKAAGQENWPLMTKALDLIAQARAEGVDITADIYPYIRNGIGLGSFIRPEHYSRGEEPFLATLSDPAVRAKLRQEVETTSDWENWYRHVGSNWDNVLITGVGQKTDKSFIGLSVKEVAKKRGVDEWQAFFDLVQEGRVGVMPQSMNEEQKHQALRAPFVMIDTDAAPVNPASVESTHPRAFGTFPRVLAKYVREDGVISLEEAVRKMTSLPANRLRLYNRGRVVRGCAADLVVFDPQNIRDTATFTKPLSHSEGIRYSIVNGQLVIDDGTVTGAMPGKVIRANRQPETSD